jgi:hypothetical protein
MADIEERLRATIARRSEGFVASADLPDRIDARVRRRRRQRHLVRGGLAAVAVAAAVTLVVLVGPIGDDEGSIRMTDQDHQDVTVPEQLSTTTSEGGQASSTSSTSTTSALPQTPATPGIDPLTSLSRQGIGPITAGMTLRQAQEVAGVTITPSPGSGSCIEARIEGVEGIVLLVEPAAGVMDGVVRAVTGSVLPTEEGAIVGQSGDELLAGLGQPTRTEPDPSGLGGEILVFEAGGYAYGALVIDGMVLGLQSGDPAWVSYPDGCP